MLKRVDRFPLALEQDKVKPQDEVSMSKPSWILAPGINTSPMLSRCLAVARAACRQPGRHCVHVHDRCGAPSGSHWPLGWPVSAGASCTRLIELRDVQVTAQGVPTQPQQMKKLQLYLVVDPVQLVLVERHPKYVPSLGLCSPSCIR